MGKFLGSLYQVYVWLIIYPLSWIITIIAAILSSILSVLGFPRIADRYIATNWARLILWITPVRVEVSGMEHLDTGQSYVIVCNHQSTYDIFALYGWFPQEFRWVMKKELRKLPFVGFACYKLGHVFVDRSNSRAAKSSIESAKRRIPAGVSVLFFPEGTRGDGTALLPFKRGAFNMARDMEWPLLPVSIQGANHIMPAKTLRIKPGCIRMVIHPPISQQEVQQAPVSQLIQKTRTTIGHEAGTAC